MTQQTSAQRRPMTNRALAFSSVALLFANLIACSGRASDGPDIRGNGLRTAALDDRARALVYDAAMRQAFDVDSSLILLVDPAILPRNGSFARDARLGDDALSGMRRAGMTRGSCETVDDGKHAPQCAADGPGYIVRFSDVYQARGDTVRVFLAAQRFRTTAGVGPAARFAFESAFELLKRGDGWRVAREGRRVAK